MTNKGRVKKPLELIVQGQNIIYLCVQPWQAGTFLSEYDIPKKPVRDTWNLKSSSNLGFAECSHFFPKLRTLPFGFIEAGFHPLHPAGKLSDVILIACPFRKSSFKLTERELKGKYPH